MEGWVNEPTDKFRGHPTRMDLCYDDRNIPRGIYTLKKQVGNNVSLCDVGNCCDMAHYMLDKHNRCELSEKDSRSFLHFLKRRPMYTKSDLELGNVDVCYQCLGKHFIGIWGTRNKLRVERAKWVEGVSLKLFKNQVR